MEPTGIPLDDKTPLQLPLTSSWETKQISTIPKCFSIHPSKSNGMFVRESLIFRSDSNGEDLEGYADAGLYESITMDTTELKKVDYVGDRLIKNSRFRTDLLSRIYRVGAAIENALGSAQDVEGVVSSDGTITVVQTRSQG